MAAGKSSLEKMVNFYKTYAGKRAWISGHTGFKGSWLSQWLVILGAQVHGYGLKTNTRPALFDQLELARYVEHEVKDIRDPKSVCKSILSFRPDFIFHLAAQAIVRNSYQIPRETFETNAMGTVNLLEAVRKYAASGKAPQILPVIVVTTDKVYQNFETNHYYKETDRLGGYDPYSSSKAIVEMAVASYRKSFFQSKPVRLVSARAGNVIGGGDWAQDRIFPDVVRALTQGQAVMVRNPDCVRPWQHVLEAASGYLKLGAKLGHGPNIRELLYKGMRRSGCYALKNTLSGAFNFSPEAESNRSVKTLVREILKNWPGKALFQKPMGGPHEAGILRLDNSLAKEELDWRPRWGFSEAVQHTVAWYRECGQSKTVLKDFTMRQICNYSCRSKS
jgi:CDP-glucose 4,6-dehydratase